MTLAIATVWVLMTLIVLGILFGSFLMPRKQEDSSSQTFRDYQLLQYERLRIFDNLRDLDADFQLQKVTTSDYEDLKADLLIQLEGFYTQIDAWESQNPTYQKILKQIESRKTAS